MDRSVPFLSACVSFVAFITTLTLVVYMLIAFITGVFDIATLMFDTVFLSPNERQSILNGLNGEFLHNIAVLLILMKAYRILVEYMRYHHIDIKFMVEITVIACALELLFNSSLYSAHMQLVLLGLSVSFLALYVFKYDTLVKAMKDSQKLNAPKARK
ncbi:MAG: phosphate-starvation-inducible PsiE family protein [Candidatus Paceibacterota bacterium]